MKKLLVLILLGASLALPAKAQMGQQAAGQTPANPLSTWLRNAYMGVRGNIARSAAKMPG